MTVYTFAISALDTGRLQALAVVAPQARYCSLLAVGAGRIDRRFVPLNQWNAIEVELMPGLDAGMWPADSAAARALALSKAHALQYVSAQPVEVPTVGAADVLDAFLRAADTTAPASTPALHQCHVWVCELHHDQPAGHDDCDGADMPCPKCYQDGALPPLTWDGRIASTDDEE